MQQPQKSLTSTRVQFPVNAPSFASPDDYYHPNVCPMCRFELHPGSHGYLNGGYRNGKTQLVACPLCAPDAKVQQNAMRQASMVARLFNGSHLPFGTRHWRFETYPPDGDKNAYSVTRNFIDRLIAGDEEGKRGLYLGGKAGRYKTSLAISALKAYMEVGGIGLFVSVPDLFKKVQATFNRNSEVSESELLETIYSVPLLVLDDLGVEKPSEFVLNELYLIIEKRRMAGLWTIITSNLSTLELGRRLSQPGDFDPAIRIVERLREYCTGVEVTGRNGRQGQAEVKR